MKQQGLHSAAHIDILSLYVEVPLRLPDCGYGTVGLAVELPVILH